MIMRNAARNSPRFADVLQDLMIRQKPARNQERGPLLLSGWIEHGDLQSVIKLSLSITRGCMRHLVYLIHHLGSCLQGSDTPIAASLLPEYREHMKGLIHGQIAARQSCPIEGLGAKLSHADHLLYLIVDQLARSSGSAAAEESLSYIFPGRPGSLKLSGSITLPEIRFLRRLTDSIGSQPRKIGALLHILFLSLAVGTVQHGGDTLKSSCHELQRQYRAHLISKAMKTIVRNRISNDAEHGKAVTCSGCMSGDGSSLFREMFDVMSDEYLVKTAVTYVQYSMNQERMPSVSERKEPECMG